MHTQSEIENVGQRRDKWENMFSTFYLPTTVRYTRSTKGGCADTWHS